MSIDPVTVAASAEIENLLAEDRTFPPDPAFSGAGQRDGRPVPRGRGGLRGVLGPARARADRLVRGLPHDPRVGSAVRQVVRRRQAEHRLQLHRPARRARASATRSPTTGSASPATRGRSPIADLQREVSKAANALRGAGDRDRRPGRHLHADDPGAADRDAGLRPDRRAAHGRLRRASRPRRCPTGSTTAQAKLVITADGGWRRGKPRRAQAGRRRGARV